ncbi:MAG: AAA family ATPase [Flavipsychrobacter sp.]
MLVRLIVGNFLSFKENTEFNMLTGNFKIHKHHVYKKKGIEIGRAAAIYGANGAGKSNLVRTIDFLDHIISIGSTDRLNIPKFKLDKSYSKKPSYIEIEFIESNTSYSYSITFDDNRIHKEGLYKTSVGKEDQLIFERTTDSKGINKINVNSNYKKTSRDKMLFEIYGNEILLPSDLFLIKFQGKKIKEIGDVLTWFQNKLRIVYPHSSYTTLPYNVDKIKEFQKFVALFLTHLDTGIHKLVVQTIPLKKYLGVDEEGKYDEIVSILSEDGTYVALDSDDDISVVALKENNRYVVKKIVSQHKGFDNELVEFKLYEESDGTKRLLDILPALFDVIFLGKIYIIDELDRSLHPYLLKKLIEVFMVMDKTEGQLIFTTHESNLLDLNMFRQDEIWFAEKNKMGETKLYPLSEFQPRYDLDIRKGYLNGRFGGIPFLGNLTDLNWAGNGE